MTTEAEVEGLQLQAKHRWRPSGAGRSEEGIPYGFQKEHGPVDTLI